MTNRFADADNLDALVHQIVGAGSVCWENPGGAGVFDDRAARDVATQALERVRQLNSDRDFKTALGREEFRYELQRLINMYSQENYSGTPDYILAQYLSDSLGAFEKAVNKRELHYGRDQDERFGTPTDPRSTHVESRRFDKEIGC